MSQSFNGYVSAYIMYRWFDGSNMKKQLDCGWQVHLVCILVCFAFLKSEGPEIFGDCVRSGNYHPCVY